MTTSLIHKTVLLCMGLLATMATGLRAGEVPVLVNYQGTLQDGTGKGVTNGNYQIAFKIWSATTGGTLIWGRAYPVHIQGGQFNVVLGDGGSPVSGAQSDDLNAVFTDASRFLGLTVTMDASGTAIANPQEINPRQQFLSAPYALKAATAGDAHTLGGSDPSSFLRSAGDTVSGDLIVNGTARIKGLAHLDSGAQFGGDLTLTTGSLTVKSGSTNLFQVTSSGTVGGGLVPIGGIIMWSGGTVPSGWALCDGTHSTPDLRGRFVLGASGSHTAGTSGGAETATLTAANLPPHTHTFSDSYFVDSGNSTWKGGGSADPNESTGKSGTQNGTTGNGPGSSSAFSILPPYYVLAYIMRTQ